MTGRNIIIKTLGYLGLNATKAQFKSSTEDSDTGSQMLDMLNDVLFDIVTQYYPYKRTKIVNCSKDGVINLTDIHANVMDVFSVTKDGIRYPFSLLHQTLECAASGQVSVEYCGLSPLTSLNQSIELPACITESTVAYGVAALYCLINGLDDALMWDRKLKLAFCKPVGTDRSVGYIKRRSFL